MIIGRVYGSVVSTHKLEGLVGYKFMLVQRSVHHQQWI